MRTLETAKSVRGGQTCKLSSDGFTKRDSGNGIAGTGTSDAPVLRGFSRSAKQDSEANTRRTEERAKRTLSFLCFETGDGHARKKRGGFTLVEVIVVIVIIAILAAIGVPALTGYIDKAQDRQYIAKARNAFVAVRAVLDEAYGTGELLGTGYFDNHYGYWQSSANFMDYIGEYYPEYSQYTSPSEVYIVMGNITIYNNLNYWDTWYDMPGYLQRASALMGEEYISYEESGGWFMYIVGPYKDSTLFTTDAFIFKMTPDMDTEDENIDYLTVTYKLVNYDGWDLESATYDPDAGYKVYHHYPYK
jgi:prepilin-type N-terminal cleavage/methylation domain-containing protein